MSTAIIAMVAFGLITRRVSMSSIKSRVAVWKSAHVVENGYGGLIFTYRALRAQRSGYGRWCDIQLGTLNWWRHARTGQHLHFFISKATGHT